MMQKSLISNKAFQTLIFAVSQEVLIAVSAWHFILVIFFFMYFYFFFAMSQALRFSKDAIKGAPVKEEEPTQEPRSVLSAIYIL